MTTTAPVTAPTSGPQRGRAAHRDPNVLRWLVAYGLSVFGDSVYFLALGWAAQELVGPAQVGMVMAVGSIPRAVLMLAGGVLADRYGPRRVVIVSDALRCVIVLAVAAALGLGGAGLGLLLVVALVFGALDAVFMPAVGALPPRITTPDQLARVQALRVLVIRVAQTAGPPTAGLAMGLGGTHVAFLISGAVFGLSLLLLLTLRVAPLPSRGSVEGATADARQESPWQELVDGLRYVRRHRTVGPLVIVVTISDVALVGTLNVGVVLLAAERGWGAHGLGWIVAGFSAGAAVGAAVVAVRGWLPRPGLLIGLAMTLVAVGAAAIGLVPVLPGAVAAAVVAGLAGGLGGTLGFALVQHVTDPAYLGRVTSVLTLGSLGIAPIGYVPFGAAVGAWGTGPVYLACGLFALTSVAVVLASPAVRGAALPRPSADTADTRGDARQPPAE